MSTSSDDYELIIPASTSSPGHPPSPAPGRSGPWWGDQLGRSAVILLCVLHGSAIWIAMGGREGIASDWPLLQVDHGIHYHHGLVTRHFLRTTGTTAGYDPSFMGGYPMSIVSDLSSTLSDLVMLAAGDRPAQGYKIHVLGAAAILPWLVGLAAICWGARPAAVLVAVVLYLVLFWTDFPRVYVELGMLNYLLSVPLGLLAVAGLSAYCERGGAVRWIVAASACSLVFLVHLTSPLIVGPAGLLAYAVAVLRSRKHGRAFSISRHAGLWAIAPVILAVNAFWFVPGYLLRSTMGESAFAFSHPEGVTVRLVQLIWAEAPIQTALLGMAPIGLAVLWRREPVAAAGLFGCIAAGFGWGYLAGAFRSLDSLQPGRHTCAFYTGACIASGIGVGEVLARLRSSSSMRLDGWASLALILVAARIFGPACSQSIRSNLAGKESFLSSRPTARASWVVEKVRRHVKPGERLLFEETGLGMPGLVDPYWPIHVSPILPRMTGVELIGGPYLHSTVTTNFTQFGENKLFENKNWDRDFFVEYARIYRPSAICCWSPKARAFCLANPDLVRVVEDDRTVLLGRVIGFEGATIRGSARVEAGPNRLIVRDAVADPGGDGLVVLRYHAAPYLKANPPTTIERVKVADDPVPFIGLRPTAGPVTIEMILPPRRVPGG